MFDYDVFATTGMDVGMTTSAAWQQPTAAQTEFDMLELFMADKPVPEWGSMDRPLYDAMREAAGLDDVEREYDYTYFGMPAEGAGPVSMQEYE